MGYTKSQLSNQGVYADKKSMRFQFSHCLHVILIVRPLVVLALALFDGTEQSDKATKNVGLYLSELPQT